MVGKVIEGTFVILILMWVLTHASEFGQVAQSVGNVYAQGVSVLSPASNRPANWSAVNG